MRCGKGSGHRRRSYKMKMRKMLSLDVYKLEREYVSSKKPLRRSGMRVGRKRRIHLLLFRIVVSFRDVKGK